jgi:hypothetical protein
LIEGAAAANQCSDFQSAQFQFNNAPKKFAKFAKFAKICVPIMLQ